MTTFVEGAIEDIDERLRQLKDELARLQAARAALNGGRRGSPRARRSQTATGTRGARARASRRSSRRAGSTRANQALELIKSRPGITIPELAEAMKIQPNYLYRVLPRLASERQVTRDGRGWRPAS